MAGPLSQSDLSIPSTPDSVTPQWLTAALRGCGSIEDATVVSISVQPMASGSGFVGQAARLHIKYDRKEPGAPTTIFAKLSSADPAVREKLRTVGIYETEAGFYKELAAIKSLPVRVPRPYVSLYDDAAATSILLLEDLGEARFGDNVTGLSPSDARIAVQQIAHLHAHFWEAPALETFSWLHSLADDSTARIALYRAMLPRFEQNCAEFSAPNLLEAARTYAELLPACIEQHCAGPQTLIHGDFRADNFAFAAGSENGGFILFDWQAAKRSRGARDVAYFLAGSLSTEQRRETGGSLLDLYHRSLLAQGVKNYSAQDLARDLQRGLGAPLTTAVIALGLLDFSSERGIGLAQRASERLGTTLEDHKFADYLADLG